LELKRKWTYGAIGSLAIALLILGGAFLGVLADRSGLKLPENVVLEDFSVNVNELTNTITVSGTGKVSGSPDLAIVTFGVVTQADTAVEAMKTNAERMTSVVKTLMQAGISEESIETTNYRVHPLYQHKTETPSIIGYRVTNEVRIETTQLDKVGELIDLAGEAEANQIHGVTFTLSDTKTSEMRDQALLEAVGNANTKADLIGGALSLTIKGVVHVTESSFYQPYQPYGYLREAAIDAVPTPIFEGDVDMVATIQVIYLFE